MLTAMRRRGRGRLWTLAAAAAAAVIVTAGGCARSGAIAGGDSSYQANLSLSPDSALRIARTQLEHHNFKVNAAGPNAVVTLPAPIPAHLQDETTRGRYWMLRVAADPRVIGGGTKLSVVGYVLPAASSAPAAGAAPKEAVVVTSANRALFGEVRAAGEWIRDEAFRSRDRR